MRALVLLMVLGLLNGCAKPGAEEPFTDSRVPPALAAPFLPPHGWTWGLVRIGEAPPLRYGVAAPPTEPRGDVLILCGHGESAEAWFETARDLVQARYAVWILDGVGEGGSGRYPVPRDLAHAPDLTVDAQALQAMTAVIGRPAMLIAQSTAAPAALESLARGLPVRAAILSAPVFATAAWPVNADAAAASAAPAVSRGRLGWIRAAGQPAWSRADPMPRGRAGVIAAWQGANPDLRMGGVSYGWIDAFQRQIQGLAPARLKAINTPVVMLQPQRLEGAAQTKALCAALPECRSEVIAGGVASLHLEPDMVHDAWLAVVLNEASGAFPAR